MNFQSIYTLLSFVILLTSTSRLSATIWPEPLRIVRSMCTIALGKAVLTAMDLIDIYRAFSLFPLLPAPIDQVNQDLPFSARARLLILRSLIDSDPRVSSKNLSRKDKEALDLLKKLSSAELNISNRDWVPLNLSLTRYQRDRAAKLKLPLIEGGRIAVKGSRRSGNMDGYHLFEDDVGNRYYSLFPLHQPYTHEFVEGRGMVELRDPPPITVEEVLNMHDFIRQNAVVPDAIAQPVGVHYVGSQFRILYEIIFNDEEGRNLQYHPTQQVIEQADLVYAEGRFTGRKFIFEHQQNKNQARFQCIQMNKRRKIKI